MAKKKIVEETVEDLGKVEELTPSEKKKASKNLKTIKKALDGIDSTSKKSPKKKEKSLSDTQVRHLCMKTAAEFDYSGLLNKNPVWRDIHENGNGIDITALIIDIAKSIAYSQMNTAINDLFHPAEYNYSKEILQKVKEIEENLQNLTRITQLVAYQDVINHRRELIDGLANVTTPYYSTYIATCRRLATETDESKRKVINDSLKNTVGKWAAQICNGTNVYYCCQNLMNMMSNPNVCLGHSYPGIFDLFGDYSSIWAAQSYPLREILREEDKYTVFSSLVLTKAYYQIQLEDYHDEIAKQQLADLEAAAERYANFMTANEASIGGCADCTLPGAEAQLNCNWTGISYAERGRRADDGDWVFNHKNKHIRRRYYYGDESQSQIDKYPTADWIEKLCAFYGHSKTIYEIFSLNRLVINDIVVRCFNGLDPSKWIVVQGDMSWHRYSIKKNHDTIYITMVNMSQKSCGASNQPAAVDCNIHGIGYCPQDADPDYEINNPGRDGVSCGIYEIQGRTPTQRR